MKICIIPLVLFFNCFAQASDWAIEYDYDSPYKNMPRSNKNKEPIYVPRYRASYLKEMYSGFGVRTNIQKDNIYYGINQDRSTEYHSKSRDFGFFYTFEDTIIETGQTKNDTPIWNSKNISSMGLDRKYFRIGKNRLFKDKLDFIVKISCSDRCIQNTLELKIADKSNSSKKEIKIRYDSSKESYTTIKSQINKSLSLTFSIGF